MTRISTKHIEKAKEIKRSEKENEAGAKLHYSTKRCIILYKKKVKRDA